MHDAGQFSKGTRRSLLIPYYKMLIQEIPIVHWYGIKRERRVPFGVSEATLIGAEGITSEGSYTWGNEVAHRFRPR